MSVDTIDALGRHDVGIPGHVRIYLFSSTQHGPATTPSLGICEQLSNTNPYFEARRALLVALERWVLEGVKPPPSKYPTLRDRTLVRPDKASVGWPDIPGVKFGEVEENTVIDFGPLFNPRDESGIVTEPIKILNRNYAILIPKVDADGNDIPGIRSTALQAPLGTYTGWNTRRDAYGGNNRCGLQGTFIPFKKTKAERLAAGDPRLSLEERYKDHAGYVAAVKAAAEDLMEEGFLLPEDAARLIKAAEDSDVLK